jgi:hypothetical protein
MTEKKSFRDVFLDKLKSREEHIKTITIKEKYNKIIATGLLLPKDKVSRNGVLYDWDSAKNTVNKIAGLPMMYNHQVEGHEKPVGHFVDAVALEKRPASGEWQEVWDKTAEELKTPQGIPGIYYKADVNPNSEYADSVTRGDVRKVSIQVIPDDQVKESDEDGNTYTRAFIKDYVESSIVPSPGFMETTMAVMCESFNVNKLQENSPDKFDRLSGFLFDKKYIELGPIQQSRVRRIIRKSPTGLTEKLLEEEKMKESDKDEVVNIDGKKLVLNVSGKWQRVGESLQEDHMQVGDEIDVGGKKMKVVEVTDDGYKMGYVEEQMSTGNVPTATKLSGREEEKCGKKKEFILDEELGKNIEELSDEEAEDLLGEMVKEAAPPSRTIGGKKFSLEKDGMNKSDAHKYALSLEDSGKDCEVVQSGANYAVYSHKEALLNIDDEWQCPKCDYPGNDIEDKVCRNCGFKPNNIEKLEENKMDTKEKLKERFDSLLEENKMLKEGITRKEYEEDMNKIVSVMEKLKEQVDELKEEDEEPVIEENVTEETEEEKKESADTPQDEDAVNKNLESKKKKKESADSPQDEDAANKNLESVDEEEKKESVDEEEKKESADSPQDEDAVNKNLESKKEAEEVTIEEQEEEEEKDVPTPPIEEKLSLKDLNNKRESFANHLKDLF